MEAPGPNRLAWDSRASARKRRRNACYLDRASQENTEKRVDVSKPPDPQTSPEATQTREEPFVDGDTIFGLMRPKIVSLTAYGTRSAVIEPLYKTPSLIGIIAKRFKGRETKSYAQKGATAPEDRLGRAFGTATPSPWTDRWDAGPRALRALRVDMGQLKDRNPLKGPLGLAPAALPAERAERLRRWNVEDTALEHAAGISLRAKDAQGRSDASEDATIDAAKRAAQRR